MNFETRRVPPKDFGYVVLTYVVRIVTFRALRREALEPC